MTRDELLDSLIVERYGRNQWWTRQAPTPTHDDSELTCARRMREALADEDAMTKEAAS